LTFRKRNFSGPQKLNDIAMDEDLKNDFEDTENGIFISRSG
jgi:hypothetical protein